jgi:hypothetical protein
VHEAGAEVGQRDEFEITVAAASSEFERPAESHVLLEAVALEHPGVERHPSRLGRLGVVAEQGLRACEPAAHDRAVTIDRAVHVGERARDPNCAHPVVALAECRVGAFPARDRLLEVELDVRAPGQAFEQVARPRVGARGLENTARRDRVTRSQRGPALRKQRLNLVGHIGIIARRQSVRTQRISGAGRLRRSRQLLFFMWQW